MGFEPTVAVNYATFPRWCLKPLGQLSKVLNHYSTLPEKEKVSYSETLMLHFTVFLLDGAVDQIEHFSGGAALQSLVSQLLHFRIGQ